MVAGSTARHWGVGTKPSRSQQQRFEEACRQLAQPLQVLGGPYLVGEQPSLVSMLAQEDECIARTSKGSCGQQAQTKNCFC